MRESATQGDGAEATEMCVCLCFVFVFIPLIPLQLQGYRECNQKRKTQKVRPVAMRRAGCTGAGHGDYWGDGGAIEWRGARFGSRGEGWLIRQGSKLTSPLWKMSRERSGRQLGGMERRKECEGETDEE